MLLVIAFCSTWLLSFITHSNHIHSDDEIDNDKGSGCSTATPCGQSLSSKLEQCVSNPNKIELV